MPCPVQRRLFIIGTTSNPAILDEMGLADVFNVTLPVPKVSGPTQVLEVLSQSAYADQVSQREMAGIIKGTVGIKKLLLVLELAKQSGRLTMDTFRDACTISGVMTYREGEPVGSGSATPATGLSKLAPAASGAGGFREPELGSPDAEDY